MLRLLRVSIAVLLLALLAQASAQTQPSPPAAPPSPPAAAPADPNDAFGVEVDLPERTIIYFKGNGNWDAAFETIVDGFKTVNAFLAKQGIKPSGPMVT